MDETYLTGKDIERGTVELSGTDTRLYDVDGELYPSMTTVVGEYEDPESKEILENWKAKYHGDGDTPHWEDLRELKALRGTIAHAKTLTELIETEIWGDEEERAKEHIDNFAEYRHEYLDTDEYPWNPAEVPFFEAGETPRDWVDRTVPQIKDNLLEHTLSDVDEVIGVEQYLYSKEHGLVGQVDLIYRDPQGRVIVCDVKTSKGVYPKHKLQSTGYALCYEELFDETVDVLKIARASPEAYQTWENSLSIMWAEDRSDLEDTVTRLAEQVNNEVKGFDESAIRSVL